MPADDSAPHLVIGGGVIGLCSAWFLAEQGREVVVVDRDETRRESCSDRNAGMVVPSHFIPLAAPGVISQGLRWMLSRTSPFYLRPRLDPSLWAWCWQFARHATKRHVRDSGDLLRDLSLESRALFERLSGDLGFEFVENGLLMLCRTEAGLDEESEVAEAARAIGLEAEVCGPERIRELDPDVEMDAIGGVWFPQDGHLDSLAFLEALRRGIRDRGGRIETGEIVDFRSEGGTVTHVVRSDGAEEAVGEVVLAGGSWSPELGRRLGIRIPMQAGKGYSFTLPQPRQIPRLCSLLKEGRVAVTPMGETLRVAGTMEICGNDLSIDPVRLKGIVDSFCQFFPAFEPEDFRDLEPWSGLRPCSPDGLPYVGRVPSLRNVTVATGHAMLGLSLGPVTGRMVADIAGGRNPDARLDPARFG